MAVGGGFFHDGRNEKIAAPKEFIAEIGGLGVFGIMKPEGAHGGKAEVHGLAHQGVIIGQEAVAQFEVLAADWFDFVVVQFGGIHNVAIFDWPHFAGVPTPGQSEMPGAAMRTEERIEGGEFKPAGVKFAGQFARGNKSADVRSPERCQAQGTVQADRHMRGQGGPAGLRVAGPNPAAEAGRAGVGVAMEAPGRRVGPGLQRAFEVAKMAGEAGFDGQFVAVVGPPRRPRPGPCREDAVSNNCRCKAGCRNRPSWERQEVAGSGVDVQDDFQMQIVEGLELLGRIGEGVGVERQ